MGWASISSIKDPATRLALQTFADKLDQDKAQTWAGLTLTNLTASQLIQTDSSKALASVADLTAFISGTANQISVTDNVGSVTLAITDPFDIPGKLTAGSFGSPTDVTATREYGFEIHYSGNNYNATGIRSRASAVTTDTSAQFQGGLFQAANNDNINVGVLNGLVAEAIGKATTNAAAIGTMRGALIGAEWSAKDTVTDLRTLHVRTHTRDNATEGYFSNSGYGIYVENEAVGGNGQALTAGIYFKGTNLSAGNKAFAYGIDFSGATFGTAEIRFSNGETIDNLTDGRLDFKAANLLTTGTLTAEQLTSTDDIDATGTITGAVLTDGIATLTGGTLVANEVKVNNFLGAKDDSTGFLLKIRALDGAYLSNIILDIDLGNENRRLTFTGTSGQNPTISNWFNQDVRTTALPSFASGVTIGTLTLADGSITDSGGVIDTGRLILTSTTEPQLTIKYNDSNTGSIGIQSDGDMTLTCKRRFCFVGDTSAQIALFAGAGQLAAMSHDGTNNSFQNSVGHFFITNLAANRDIQFDSTTDIEFKTNSVVRAIILEAGETRFDGKVAFTQIDLNEYIDSLNDGYMDYGATTAHRFDNIVVLPKTSGKGIQVDITTPTFGWRDLLGDQFTKNTGGTKPTLVTYNGVVDAWQFSDGDEAFLTYHIPHDYVAGTDIHLHVHWSQNNAGATGGTIDFKYFAIYAKSHNQVSGSTFTSTPVTDTFSSIDINDGDSGLNQYQQHFTEVVISAASATVALFDRDDFEPDGVIELTLEMDANNLTGTPSDPFIHYVDIHYQSTNIGTKDKVPNFYT